MKIRHCSNCGLVYSGTVCLHRSTVRNNNKMEVKRCREGRGGKRAGLVTEGMMYRSRLTGCCGRSIPMGKRSLLGDSPGSSGSLREQAMREKLTHQGKRVDGKMDGCMNNQENAF